jgi:hypothetical protein
MSFKNFFSEYWAPILLVLLILLLVYMTAR